MGNPVDFNQFLNVLITVLAAGILGATGYVLRLVMDLRVLVATTAQWMKDHEIIHRQLKRRK
jgi:hypothetical protein